MTAGKIANAIVRFLNGAWWVLYPGTTILAMAFYYIRIAVWLDGRHVGDTQGFILYPLLHGSYAVLFLASLLCFMVSHLWLLIAFIAVIFRRINRRIKLFSPEALQVTLMIVSIALVYIGGQ